MITLKEYLKDKTRKYIAVQYDSRSQKLLRKWAETNGFDLSVDFDGNKQDPNKFDFHTTIFYTTNEVYHRGESSDIDPVSVTIIGLKFLGENEDIPVLLLENSGGLKNLREYYEGLDFEDKWPTYQPHISLSYAKQTNIDLDKIELPTFNPVFNRVEVQNIKS